MVSQYQEYKAGRGYARTENDLGTRVSLLGSGAVHKTPYLTSDRDLFHFLLLKLAGKYSVYTSTADHTFTSRREASTKKSTDEQLNLLYKMHGN